ncbi:MAG: hypothetical protein Q9162_000753 [Coniocarpon cinnabarinum]
MLSIYNSLQSQGLTHTQPSTNGVLAPIEHMLPQRIWQKLQGLYDLETLDEREEHYRAGSGSREASEGSNERDASASRRIDWQFERDFELDAARTDSLNADQAEDFAERMFARRLKPASEPASSPPLDERSISETASVRGGRGRTAPKSTRNSLRQSTQPGRRGSRTTTATTSTVGDDDDRNEAQEDTSQAQIEVEKPGRATRGSVKEANKKSKRGRKKA